jgi:hypothetical protein
LATQLQNLFGSSKIPLPNYGGNPATTGDTASSNKLRDSFAEQAEKTKKLIAKVDEVRAARLAYSTAKNELPAGDPQLDELRNKWLELAEELKAL